MKKIALLFPGQGSQYVGMGKYLCENYKIAQETFEQANEVLGFDLKQLCFEGSMEQLTKTENTQPAILTASVAAYRVYLEQFGAGAEFMAGHSLGEFSALVCSGAMRFVDAVRIVNKRGKFMQEAVPVGVGSMAAISGISKEIIEKECSQYSKSDSIVVVSNYNTPDQIVISGHVEAVNQVGETLKKAGARVTPLKVSAPFHSPLMQPAADKLKEELKKYNYDIMKYKVISNVTAQPYESSDDIIENLSVQIVSPVRWQESVKYLESHGIEIITELGPQTVLKNMMSKNAPAIRAFSFDKQEDMKGLKEALSIPVNEIKASENMPFRLIVRCLAIAVCTKNSNWDNDEYTRGVIEPYKTIQKLQNELQSENREPSIQQMKDALIMLKKVFETKRTPLDEQRERFNQIFMETGLKDVIGPIDIPV